MISAQDKRIVAENCKEYESKNSILGLQVSYISGSCSNCVNFVNNKCSKDLLYKIEQVISMN
ncbi:MULTISPECIES: hypothetical protein [Clostridium]|uniref:Uncharacterized protein n=5 Tax=Clostridium TaxID=1485 RepID=D8GK78_CLOLD|nr:MULTISPECIES: hypothetical protein [Clostridium]ADK13196.1 hypothetical protein CLJU_c00940 [Clostridium ljungdahlii DSM 13528]AGY76421.1 hypothetical protein CAETHG_2208 [Clostridium autoethanogenum DSM 10061]ALU36584.1 Hypothetical protein CLAU_2155 [Clostridium autoethanogenum DSM 10061]AZV55187.1 hypothetical protein DMR38_00390 [Clostridium sp. AWRP]OAA84437.1 hypothetical protein WX45_01103 [Clostridium ljungdahlii DSM 13528]